MDLLRKLWRVTGYVVAGVAFLSTGVQSAAQVSVTTWLNDIGRTGQNLNETILAPSNVNSNQFGKLFSQPVDGYVYAQPLYLPSITINGTSHNAVFVATEHDSVYAFDADSNSGGNSSPLWFASMLSTAHGAASGATTISSNILGTDIIPEIGITGTPVIDTTTGTLYVVSATQEGSSTFVQRLHALDVTTGAEKFGGPVVITASVPGTGNGSLGGTLTFDSEWQNQRPGLLLLNGIVYIAFASHGDNGPWHGWVMGYNAQTLKQTGVFCTSPNGTGAGIWMAGAGLAAEVADPVNHPYGRMFVATGNGDFTATKPYTSAMDYGDSILNLDLTNGVPTVTDDFTPYNQANLDQYDTDQGSGGILLLPKQTAGNYPNLLVQAGKSGTVYLLNRDSLGGYNSGGDQVVQELPYGVGNIGAWSSPAYWNGTVYYWGQIATMQAYALSNGLLKNPPLATSETYNFPGASPTISANGNSNAIVWSIDSEGYRTSGSQVLQAHDAVNPGTTLYSSSTNSTRDNPGGAVKFAVPTVVNGKVYVGSSTQLSVYGLLNGTPTASAPVFSPGPESFNGTLQVTMTDSTPGATIYYTTDGSTPTVSSQVYSTPVAFSVTTTVKAMAIAANYLESPITTGTYTESNQTAVPVIMPGGGTYSQPVSVTISDTTSGATIYYTTDGSTPTTSSTKYTGAMTVSTSETISAMAAAAGYNNSAVSTAAFTISNGGTPYINIGTNGFTAASFSVNNGAAISSGDLQLTDGGTGENRSAWFSTQVPIGSFVTDFTFQQSNAIADGMTFAIQNNNIWALGYPGSGLGYQTIPKSVAIKFDIYDNAGEGTDSTGLYLNGAAPTVPSTDLSTTGVTLRSGDVMHAHIVYDGTNLTMILTDTVTNASTTKVFPVNIPATVGGNTAWVGFTGATGGLSSVQRVLSWSMGPPSQPTAATPTISPAAGTYTSAQSVSISDSTGGATIYYTTDGSTPSASSAVYSAPITVSTSETVQAIAVASGYSNSSVATAAYTIAPVLPAPTFQPAAGTYTSTQSVTISAAPGATIYYSTDGTTPTTSSAVYAGAITVSATQTIQAFATETGYTPSPVSSATYTLQTGIAFPTGFAGTQGSTMIFNGSTGLNDTRLQLTNGGANEAASAWYYQPVNVQSFTTDFSFQLSNAAADGITFAIQGNGVSALGSAGAGLGYQGIGKSIAVKFDFYNDAGEGSDSTGLYTNGVIPTVPAIDLSNSGINLQSGDTMDIHLVYDGTTLSMSIYDIVTGAGYSTSWPVNIPALVGGNTAYLGFTGGSNALSSSQKILTWTYAPGSTTAPTANSPAFNPPGGTYSTAPSVTISDSTSGATIYYTTDGSTPTAASHVYSSPVALSSGQTLKALAAASGFTNSAVAVATYTTGPTLPTPTFSPAPGSYSSAQTVTISDATAGTTIYYTTDGSTPTHSSTVYSGPIAVASTETVKAIAVESGYVTSGVGSAAYTISTIVAAPVISPASGTYTTVQTVTITDSTPGATIYYTTNGTTPTTASSVYAAPITVSSSENVEAMATATGYTNSPVTTANYTINLQAATPTFSPVAGSYTSTQTVTIADSTPGATIYYTTNGTTPTTSSTVYSGAISVSSSETIKAIASASGYSQSAIASAAYTITLPAATPTFTPAAGSFTSAQTVTISDATSGATIYFTTNGTTPTTSSTKYTGPITVNTTETIKAIAVATGYSQSAVGSAAYTITLPAASPTFSPGAGNYTSAQVVTISDATTGATIYYTTNGSTPTTSSAVYSGPVTVSVSETLEAIATASGYSQSAVSSAVYTITPPAGAPSFSPAPGTYTSAQTVTISDGTPGATIYFTTDGTAPTTTSPVYSGPIAVGSSETIKAIATASGYAASSIASATYTINSGSTTYISYANGAFSASNLSLNYGATVTNGVLQLTNGGSSQNRSAWFSSPVPVGAFTTDFNFQQTNASADGMTFTIQNNNIWALGYSGAGLGYQSIPSSVAVKFDLYDNAGEGNNSTGIYTNGVAPTTPAIDLTSSGINLHSGDIMHAHIAYDGTNLTLTLTDTVTNASTTQIFPINIPAIVGGTSAYVGFTGATGGMTATQNVLSWTYTAP